MGKRKHDSLQTKVRFLYWSPLMANKQTYRKCYLSCENLLTNGVIREEHAVVGKTLNLKSSRSAGYSERIWTVIKVESDVHSIENMRNIGISAHVDAGKTLLTEQILKVTNKFYYTKEME